MALPMDRFLNLIYYFATEDAEPKEKDKFDIRLNMPDERARRKALEEGVPETSPWSKRNEEQSLSGFVAQLSGKG
jgi:hypothetical protein